MKIDIVFDGPPGPESGRFVEVEDEQGHNINAGEWIVSLATKRGTMPPHPQDPEPTQRGAAPHRCPSRQVRRKDARAPCATLVEVTRFERAIPCAQGRCSTRLSHTSKSIVPPVGLEPTSLRVRTACSALELQGRKQLSATPWNRTRTSRASTERADHLRKSGISPAKPCNYTGGGLFNLNPLLVEDLDGAPHRLFAFAKIATIGGRT